MKIIRIIALFIILILASTFLLYAQTTKKITLVFKQTKNNSPMIFPSSDISTWIDTLYNKGDTLSIRLIDDRIIQLSNEYSRHKMIWMERPEKKDFYYMKLKRFKQQLDIPTIEAKCNFVEMQIYDEIYLFKKKKNEYILENRYELENKTIAELKQENSKYLTGYKTISIGKKRHIKAKKD